MRALSRLPVGRQLSSVSQGSAALATSSWTSSMKPSRWPPSHQSSPSNPSRPTRPQLRSLATKHTSRSRPAKTSKSTSDSQGSKQPERTILTPDMVPPLEFWQKNLPQSGCQDLTPEQCHAAVRLYCDGTDNRNAAWARKLVREIPDMTPYLLHCAGTTLLHGDLQGLAPEAYAMGMNLLHTAHLLDYTPSTLQLVLMWDSIAAATSPPGAGGARKPIAMLAGPLARFDALAKAGRDPDVLVMQAHRLDRAPARAHERTQLLLKARRLGMALHPDVFARPPPSPQQPNASPRPPLWLGEADCHLAAGAELHRRGRADEAAAAFALAAFELDSADGLERYAAVAPADGIPRREEMLVRAAASGSLAACAALAETERGRASESDGKWHAAMADEWAALVRESGRLGGAL